MICVTAPGLPSRPKLWFDPETRRAKVSDRHPTWQSHEWAIPATELVVWIVNGFLAWFLWPLIPHFDPVFRVMLFLLTVAVVSSIATYLLRMTLREFFARQIFAARTVLWFSPEAIVVRSRLYENPVVIWRMWNSQPVKGRFVLQSDKEAEKYNESLGYKRKAPRHHFRDAKMLEIVLSTVNRHNEIGWDDNQSSILRSIPITEISDQFAAKFTMVYAAAAALTSPTQQPNSNRQGDGIDIDAA